MSFKEQLKNEILPRAVEYYNSGEGINESIVKAASDFSLNLEQTYRLLETMNTARTIAHYEKNAEDRTQGFDIADKDAVRRMLFSDNTEKKAAASVGGWYDYSAYDAPEKDYLETRSDGSVFTKAAEANEPGVKEFTRSQVLEKVASYKNELTEQHNFASGREGMARDWLATSISKLASDLSKGYEPERRYALFKVACPNKDVVAEVEKEMHPSIVKDAASYVKQARRSNVLDPSEVSEQLKLAEEIVDGMEAVGKIHKVVETLAKKEAEARALLARYQATQTEGKLDFFGYKEAAGTPPKDNDKDKDKPNKNDPWYVKAWKNVPNAPQGVKNVSDYLMGAANDPKKIDEIVNKKKQNGTSLKEYVNNMRRSDIISELYDEDPIISEANPDDVSKAYATLVQTAPEASLNKEVVRAILRQSVNSVAVSPFDAKQWADLDKTMLESKKINAQLSGRV